MDDVDDILVLGIYKGFLEHGIVEIRKAAIGFIKRFEFIGGESGCSPFAFEQMGHRGKEFYERPRPVVSGISIVDALATCARSCC